MGESKSEGVCTVAGCTHAAGMAGGTKALCPAHYQRQRRGVPLDAPLRGVVAPLERTAGLRVPDRVRDALEAEASASGRDVGEVIREVLGAWADKREKRAAKVKAGAKG